MQDSLFCPYCGEAVDTYVDPGGDAVQSYVEDCAVCCRPIRFDAEWDDADREYRVRLARDD